jgi:hypothetical protein
MVGLYRKGGTEGKTPCTHPIPFCVLCIANPKNLRGSRTSSDIPLAKHVLSNVEGAQRRQVRKRFVFLKPSRLSAFARDIPISFFALFTPFALNSSGSESLVAALPR